MCYRILIIEDDHDIADLVQLHLRDLHVEADIAHDGTTAWEKLRAGSFDLVVLDLALPDMDGLEICRRLRAQPHYTLILMLTGKTSEFDRVLGLELGADDYLTKPFSVRELVARVKALFRCGEAKIGALTRAAPDTLVGLAKQTRGTVRSAGIFIEADKRRVTIGGQPLSLTAKEFDLLWVFACHPGRVYTRTQLLDAVWGLGFEGYEHTVNSHINRLRGKIEKDVAHPRFLLTVWGVGYKFAEGAE
jgi:DNA-binding response OmpR family regulator